MYLVLVALQHFVDPFSRIDLPSNRFLQSPLLYVQILRSLLVTKPKVGGVGWLGGVWLNSTTNGRREGIGDVTVTCFSSCCR